MKFFLTIPLVMLVMMAQHAFAGVLFERSVAPAGWTMKAPSPANAPVSFIVALKQRNLEVLDRKFWSVSDPMSKDYQNFLDREQINEIVAPDQATVEEVRQWLLSHGVSSDAIKVYGDAIEATTDVERASQLFSTHFFSFVHDESGKVLNKAWGKVAVPDYIHKKVDFVDGVTTFPIPRLSKSRKVQVPDPNNWLTVPQLFHALYSLPANLQPLSNPTTTHAVIEYEGQYFSNDDIATFNAATSWNVSTINSSTIVGSNDLNEPQDEASLDVQWQGATNPTATPWFWIEAGETWLYGWAVHFLNTTTVPQVTSTSYCFWEGDQCSVTDECGNLGVHSNAYVQRVNVEFQKIAVVGSSIIVASGDSGASGDSNSDCTIPQLRLGFPASSPYVTSVGATEIRKPQLNLTNAPPICSGQGYKCISGGTEAATSVGISGAASGGGFSNYLSRPSYQSSAVAAYFASGVKLPPSSYYNSTGRGAPDVAALGQFGYAVMDGVGWPVAGTSMSSPIFSGVVSLLNAEAIKLSGKPLGFLNPLLYSIAASNPSAFQDITEGDNFCTMGACPPSCEGYYATKGWDPVTGLGTPNYPQLLKSVQALFADRRALGL